MKIPNISRPRFYAGDGILMRKCSDLLCSKELRHEWAQKYLTVYEESAYEGKAKAAFAMASIGLTGGGIAEACKITNGEKLANKAFGVVAHDRVLAPDKRATSLRYKIIDLKRETHAMGAALKSQASNKGIFK